MQAITNSSIEIMVATIMTRPKCGPKGCEQMASSNIRHNGILIILQSNFGKLKESLDSTFLNNTLKQYWYFCFCKQKVNPIVPPFSFIYTFMLKTKTTLVLTNVHRITVLILIALQYILFFYTLLMMVNYHAYPLPFFNYKSMVSSTTTETHYLWNISLYILFWGQHIIMATLKYKLVWLRQWEEFALYDRYIYNIMSGVALYITFSLVQPSQIQLFTIPEWVCMPFKLYGLGILLKSMREVGSTVMMPFKVSTILNEKQLILPSYTKQNPTILKTDGIYGLLRHPMQGGALCLITFGNNIYTTQRLLYVLTFGIFVVIGVIMQEQRLKAIFKDYSNYMKKVRARFIPYLI